MRAEGCRSWTLGSRLPPGYVADKACGSWVSVTATCAGPQRFRKLHLACFLSFCFNSAGRWRATQRPLVAVMILGLKLEPVF